MKEDSTFDATPDPRIQAAMALLGRIRARYNGSFPPTPEYYELQARTQAVEYATMMGMPIEEPVELYIMAVRDYADSTILKPLMENTYGMS